MNFTPSPATTEEITDETTQAAGVKLFVKRLDLIHPVISGNKWFKLKYNLQKAKDESYKSILTFGGAYSNHIAATAAATKLAGFGSIGIIRGERPAIPNPVLMYAEEQGMHLIFIPRIDYKKRYTDKFINELKVRFDDPLIIPEGGSNVEGVKGCLEILSEEEKQFHYIFCASGTATTLTGLILSCKKYPVKLKGISVLKNAYSLSENVNQFITYFDHPDNFKTWEIIHDYDFGGYAKSTEALMSFINNFVKTHKFAIEPVYTGKTFFAVYDLLKRKYFDKGAQILVIHSGGFHTP